MRNVTTITSVVITFSKYAPMSIAMFCHLPFSIWVDGYLNSSFFVFGFLF